MGDTASHIWSNAEDWNETGTPAAIAEVVGEATGGAVGELQCAGSDLGCGNLGGRIEVAAHGGIDRDLAGMIGRRGIAAERIPALLFRTACRRNIEGEPASGHEPQS